MKWSYRRPHLSFPLGKLSPAGWVIPLLGGILSLVSASPAAAEVPHGVFSMTVSGNPTNDTVLTNPNVDGISIRDRWSSLEPTEGHFDWAYLDSAVAAAGDAGKQVILRITTMADRPAWVDTAVKNAGGKFFVFTSDGVPTSIPLFWDPVFLEKKKALIVALGAHFANNPAVTMVWASFANAASEDWNVPHTADLIPQWLSLGYTSDKMLGAGQQIIDTTMRAFPYQYVTLAEGGDGPNLDPSLIYVASTTIATERAAWPDRLVVQRNSLSTFIPVAPATIGSVWRLIWDSRPMVGAQMIAQCVNDPNYRVNNGIPIDPAVALRRSIKAGVSYGVNFVEIPQIDVVNLPKVISYAHRVLIAQ